MHTVLHKRNICAFTLIEIMIVVAIIGIIAGIAIPSYMKSRAEARLAACKQNLKTIATAIETCKIRHPELVEGDHSATYVLSINEECVLYQEGYLKAIPKCPGNGGEYQMWYYPMSGGYYYIRHNGGGTGAHADLGIQYPFPRYQSRGGVIEEKLP